MLYVCDSTFNNLKCITNTAHQHFLFIVHKKTLVLKIIELNVMHFHFRNRNFWMLGLPYAISCGVYAAWGTVYYVNVKPLGISEVM